MYETQDAGKAQKQFCLCGTLLCYTKIDYSNTFVSVHSLYELWLNLEAADLPFTLGVVF